MKKIAIVGLGNWGKNLLREFSTICTVSICCTKNERNYQNWLKKNYPKVRHTTSLKKIINDNEINAVVIATPIDSHFILAREVLNSGKHVFVEKPLAKNVKDAVKLIELAKEKNLSLFVGHTFLFHPVLKKIKQITKKEPIIYANFNWLKLGTFNENILYDLLSHDIAIILKLIGKPNLSLLSSQSLITESDVISVEAKLSKKRKCIININRAVNYKKKTVIFLTKKNLFVWDDSVLYKFSRIKKSYEVIFQSTTTPLEIECEEFIKSIKKKNKDWSNANHSLEVIKCLAKL